MTDPTPKPSAVTVADRKAAVDWWSASKGLRNATLQELAEQFARHRQASHAAEVERLRAENEALLEVANNAREALLYFKLHNGWRMTANEYDLAANAMAQIDQLTATGDRHE